MLSMTMNDTDRNKEFTQPPGPHLHSIPSFYSVPQTLQSFQAEHSISHNGN